MPAWRGVSNPSTTALLRPPFADHGIFNLTSGDFWAIGQVTSASGRWHYLEGYTFLGFGVVEGLGTPVMTTYAPSLFIES